MSKRPGSAAEANPPKRPRKATGFRVARAASALQSIGPSTSNSTLHVTVNPPNERRGTTVTTRVFSNTPEQAAQSSTPATLSDFPEPAGDTQHDQEDTLNNLPESPSVAEATPKRKRNTKNAVSHHSGF
jgi:hypothetical protein